MLRLASLLLLFVSLSGCATLFAPYKAARKRAPYDLQCSQEEIRQGHDAGGYDTFVFLGCGRGVSYKCTDTGSGSASCLVLGRSELTPSGWRRVP